MKPIPQLQNKSQYVNISYPTEEDPKRKVS